MQKQWKSIHPLKHRQARWNPHEKKREREEKETNRKKTGKKQGWPR
jgi:hypothetical protein